MTIKTIITAAALTLAPMLAVADCAYHDKQAMTCAEGSAYDAETNSCKVVTG